MKFTTAILALVSCTTLVMAWPDKGEYAKRGLTDGCTEQSGGGDGAPCYEEPYNVINCPGN
ncbi:hypothetical protein BDW42DRAFT_198204 [Aspergillus taichungensis]|uniref:Uncharacterized protein n=1 Tax=Aspergillus taichungensis TaxID=482145 RepID=A0A2J5HCW4_9EURO|nr:hypothetical protein BDW42DRAFT_198204 [Aspergillus taichungensis]